MYLKIFKNIEILRVHELNRNRQFYFPIYFRQIQRTSTALHVFGVSVLEEYELRRGIL